MPSPQPVPVPLAIAGGIDEKADQAVAERAQRIINARYARGGALSKRNGYAIVEEYANLGDNYVAFDGDKFFARKNDKLGVEFYQRRDRDEYSDEAYNFLIGETGRMRPALTSLPGQRGPSQKDGVLSDVAYSTATDRIGPVVLYVRLEMVERVFDFAYNANVTRYDIVIDYIDPADERRTQRQPTRIKNAVTYKLDTRQQIRAVLTLTSPSRLWLVYSGDDTLGNKGIFARVLDWGNEPASDVVGVQLAIVNDISTVPYQGNRKSGGFDVAPMLNGFFSVFYTSTPFYLLGWARYATGGIIDYYHPWAPGFSDYVTSVSISSYGDEHVVAWTGTSQFETSFRNGYAGRFRAPPTAGVAPTNVSSTTLYEGDEYSVPAHSSVTSIAVYTLAGTNYATFYAGVNSPAGFRWATGPASSATFHTNINAIACAWATGRPAALYSPGEAAFARVVVPLVAWGGELGGGAGLLADITPSPFVDTGGVLDGAPLLATYAIDQVSLDTRSIAAARAAAEPAPHVGDENSGLAIVPNRASDAGPRDDPRWLIATGKPAAPVMLSLRVPPVDDFEFLEPGVMLMGPGVPVLCDAIQGVSELGFHASPGVIRAGAFNFAGTGNGYAAGAIIQYRFQYRYIDGLGRAQVSPMSEPYQMTSALAETQFEFTFAPYDCTVRSHPVMIDIYRTDDKTADFCWFATVTARGGNKLAYFADTGPNQYPRDETVTPNVENYFMTPPCANVALRGSFRHVIVTRENELWPSKRRLATTAPQFDIIDAAAWDSVEPVTTGGEIDGKLILFSRNKIAYTYEANGGLAPFTDIPSDTGAVEGSRAVSTLHGVFYQSAAGIRLIGRDLAYHEVGQMVGATLGAQRVRGGVRFAAYGEVRLRLSDGFTYLVFDYIDGGPDSPCWYVYKYDADPAHRARVDEKLSPDGRLLFLTTSGSVLYETVGRYVDETSPGIRSFVRMRVLSAPARGQTAMSYLATIEGAVNLELPPLEVPLGVRLSLVADYSDSRPVPALVSKTWTAAEIEAFDRRQLQVTATENVSNAPAVALLYEDVPPDDVEALPTEGFGYRLSAMVMVYSPRDQRSLFPVANEARK